MKIAFDFDGTIVTCETKQVLLLRAISAKLHNELDYSSLWQLKRNGLSTQKALQANGVGFDESCYIAKRWEDSIEQPFWTQFDTLFPGVRALLEQLKRSGIRLLLLTARKNSFVLFQQLSRLQLTNLFETISVVSPRFAIEQKSSFLNLWSPDLFIGDTESDGAAAKRAGVSFFSVGCGQRDPEYLKQQGYSPFTDLCSAFDTIFKTHTYER